MKKAYLTLLTLCLAVSATIGQTIPITLSDEHPVEQVSLPAFNSYDLGQFTFTKGEADANGNATVTIEVENTSIFVFVLFDKSYDLQYLRKKPWRIVPNKTAFAGNSPVDEVEGVDLTEIQRFPYNPSGFASQDDNIYRFPNITVKEGQSKELTVPLYLARTKPIFLCSQLRFELMGKSDLSFTITIEQSDKDFDRIKAAFDDIDMFADSLGENQICTNALHQPSYKKTIEPYTNEIKQLQDEIDMKLADRRHPLTEKKRKEYIDLQDKLERIESYLTSGYKYDCGKHKKHSCQYCKLSLEQIYRKLDNSYIELSTTSASEFDAKKKNVMKEASAMYKCCTDSSCAKHAAQWKKGGQIKQKIIDRYDQLKKM